MLTSDFDYHLPEGLIAQHPVWQRDRCRLLVLDRSTGAVSHKNFADIVGLARPGDLFVLNDTRVLPARLFCRKPSGGNCELLFTGRIDDMTWRALAKPGRRLKAGSRIVVRGDPGAADLVIESVTKDGERTVRLAGGRLPSLDKVIEGCGHVPLPPYIRRPDSAADREDYQTVYAREPGAIAAPTAGLHFTPGLLAALRERGAGHVFLTLHVGAGTFLPVKTDDPRGHPMHEEEFELPQETAVAVMRTKQAGGRVIAVGTTVVRVLEHCAQVAGEPPKGCCGRTSLKILPPYEFRTVDGLITNFHLPMSTLLMLVSAFASRELVLTAYAEAVREKYRFFSYGDAMFIC